MVQILEDQPSFSSQLLRSGMKTGTALGKELAGSYFNKKKENEESKKFKEQFGFDLPEEARKEYYKSFAKEAGKSPFREKLEQQKTQKEELQKTEELTGQIENWENVFTTMKDLLKYTGTPTIGPSFFKNVPWSEAAGKNEEFDVLGFQLEKWAMDNHTKGTLSDAKFDRLMEKVPNSKLSNSQNKGRMRAWYDVIVGEKKKELSKFSKKEKKQLTPDIIDSFLDETGNDIKEAKKLAADRGYTW